MDFPDKWAAIVWMCRNQLGRRNITDEQKTALIGEAYKAQKMTAGGDRRSDNFSKGQNGLLKKYENTAQKIADDFGVGEQTVKRAEHFIDSLNEAEKVSPGIKAARMAFKAESRGYSPAFLLPVGYPQTMFGHRGRNHYHRKGKARQKDGLVDYSVTRSPFGRIKELSYLQPTAFATSFSSAGVNPSRFIFCENACGLVPHLRANSDTLILSFTHRIFNCSDVAISPPPYILNYK